MVRAPTIELSMQRSLVIEITVPTINRQLGRGNGHENSAGTTLNHFTAFTRSNDDDFVAEARCRPQFRVDIGAHAAAGGRVESADVDNSHGCGKPGNALNLK